MYTDKVMDHFEHPRNVGELENPSGMGTVGNPKCGDIMRIYLDIDDQIAFFFRSGNETKLNENTWHGTGL